MTDDREAETGIEWLMAQPNHVRYDDEAEARAKELVSRYTPHKEALATAWAEIHQRFAIRPDMTGIEFDKASKEAAIARTQERHMALRPTLRENLEHWFWAAVCLAVCAFVVGVGTAWVYDIISPYLYLVTDMYAAAYDKAVTQHKPFFLVFPMALALGWFIRKYGMGDQS